MKAPSGAERRAPARRYDALLPAHHPVKLCDAFIGVDFVVAGAGGAPLDARVSPRRMLAWLHSMPSYRAGVPLRIGHAADAGLEFGKAAELIGLADPARPVVYATALPLPPEARAFFARPRANLLLLLTASPRRAGGPPRDPLELIGSASGLDPRGVHWIVGPLAAGDEEEARRILGSLPPGSRLTLRPGPAEGAPLQAAALARLEAAAHALGLSVSEWTCRASEARVGRGSPQVARLTSQADLARRAHDLITCAGCPSRTQCHGPLDDEALLPRLERELRVLGLTRTAPPRRTGPRTLAVEVAEPAAPGDEAYLSYALGHPVAVTLSTAARAGAAGPEVLRRWYAAGFLPVTELNAAAERLLEDLERRRQVRGA